MWLLIVEMLIALALLLFIVWWIAFPSRKQPVPDGQQPGPPSEVALGGEQPLPPSEPTDSPR